MNLIKRLAMKAGMVGAVILLWVLDDLVPILPDSIVWDIVNTYLRIVKFGGETRLEGLKEFWTGNPPQ